MVAGAACASRSRPMSSAMPSRRAVWALRPVAITVAPRAHARIEAALLLTVAMTSTSRASPERGAAIAAQE
jgi:hypothetical protein